MRTILYRLIAKLYHVVADYRYRTRIKVLIDGGLVLGKNVNISPSVVIDNGNPYLIRIGDNCSIAEHTRLLTHDATPYKFTNGHTRLGKIELKDNCFIGEKVVILPGVTIGPDVLVAAGSVVNRDIPPNSCVAGVPARVYGKFDQFIERQKQLVETARVFEIAELTGNLAHKDEQIKAAVWEAIQEGQPVYVRGNLGDSPFLWNKE